LASFVLNFDSDLAARLINPLKPEKARDDEDEVLEKYEDEDWPEDIDQEELILYKV
jgi:hypothetical protein